MASWVQIASEGLAEIGEEPIQDFDEDNDNARACKGVYQAAADLILSLHPWNVGLRRAQLAADATAPAWGYANRFTLPAAPDYCLRVWRVRDDPEFKVLGRAIETDEGAPLSILYSARVTHPEEIPPYLARVIALEIAMRVAPRRDVSETRRARLQEKRDDALAAARSADAQEGTPENFSNEDDLLAARL